jgi:hypothetical protein
MTGKYLEASAQLLLESLAYPQGSAFMTSPGPECTTGAFEKHRMWPKGDMFESCPRAGGQARAGQEIGRGVDQGGGREATPGCSDKVTGNGLLAIRGQADIVANHKIIVPF